MTGLCGWIGLSAGRDSVEAMGASLAKFDHVPVRAECGTRSAVAVAAQSTGSCLLHVGSVVIAISGQARWRGQPVDRAPAEELGRALVADWKSAPAKVLQSLSGAFTLCMLDEASGEALLGIDRLGTHPLAWLTVGEGLVFGSSTDALARHPAVRMELDHQSIYNYVYFHAIHSPRTVFSGVQRLLPGEYLQYRQGRIETGTYWRVQFDEQGGKSFGELKEEFKSVLRSSVREAIEGQNVGAFLSGGTDSSTISGILCEVGGKPAQTYSIGFEAQGYDEMEYARCASRHFGTEHHEYYVTPDDVVAAIPQIAAAFDQPFGNASAVPTFYCARLAKADGLSRMLGGDGGDELFGGNERYSKQTVFGYYERVPALFRKALLEPVVFNFPGGSGIKVVRKARSYIEQASVPMPARLETYNLLGRYGPQQVFTDEFLANTDAAHPLASLEHTYGRSEARSLINRMLELDLKVTLADNDLPKVVGACTLAGMDVAFPFLNDEMVAFSARLTPQQKLNGTQLRWFFKEALRDFLPNEIITKQKHGFGLPFGVWLQDHAPLQQLASDSLTDLKKRGIVRPAFIDQLVGHHLKEHAGYHGTMVWVLMMLEQWFRQHRQG